MPVVALQLSLDVAKLVEEEQYKTMRAVHHEKYGRNRS